MFLILFILIKGSSENVLHTLIAIEILMSRSMPNPHGKKNKKKLTPIRNKTIHIHIYE